MIAKIVKVDVSGGSGGLEVDTCGGSSRSEERMLYSCFTYCLLMTLAAAAAAGRRSACFTHALLMLYSCFTHALLMTIAAAAAASWSSACFTLLYSSLTYALLMLYLCFTYALLMH